LGRKSRHFAHSILSRDSQIGYWWAPIDESLRPHPRIGTGNIIPLPDTRQFALR